MTKLYLASASPQRFALLQQLGLEFEAIPVKVDESWSGEGASEHVQRLAEEKAKALAAQLDDGLVIGADTVVEIYGHVLGKPTNPEEAAKTIQTLSGRWHKVLTGVCVLDVATGRTSVEFLDTRVKFRLLQEGEIASYVGTGEWQGRAGGYAIQLKGSVLVDEIQGDYFNVVGLPLTLLYEMLADFGLLVF